MPSIVRFLVFLLVIGGLGFAAIFALATFVEPEPREVTIDVPSSRLTID
ncbi:MAG: histidine kinase [Pseudomonadota bacterium]